MYKEVGDIFKYQNITLQVVENCDVYCREYPIYLKEYDILKRHCKDCYFYKTFKLCNILLCSKKERKDHKDVIFKKYNNK